jgi:hypothetical protein
MISFSSISGENTIEWLGQETLNRYLKLKPAAQIPDRNETILEIRYFFESSGTLAHFWSISPTFAVVCKL